MPAPASPRGKRVGPGDDDEDDHRGNGLTDLDCLARLSVGGLGGRNSFGPNDYAALSDRQILALLSIELDNEGDLVTEWSKRSGEATGSIARAGRELPKPEDVGLDDASLQEALSLRPFVNMRYAVMFWSVWRKRGLSEAETMEQWRQHMASNN